jgi:microcystin-dependent protein
MSAGQQMLLVADGVLPLTYNATTNKIAGGVSVILTAGGLVQVVKDLSGVIQTTPIGNGVPTGTILSFGGTAAPTGYLGCDGSNVSRTTYAGLFAAIGVTWGAGDSVTTFGLPNLARRVAVGSGGSGTATLGNAVGNTGGAETHTLITGEIPSHTHPLSGGPNAVTPASIVTVSANATPSSSNTGSAGGGGAHNNMQPSAVVLSIIKT